MLRSETNVTRTKPSKTLVIPCMLAIDPRLDSTTIEALCALAENTEDLEHVKRKRRNAGREAKHVSGSNCPEKLTVSFQSDMSRHAAGLLHLASSELRTGIPAVAWKHLGFSRINTGLAP